MIKAWTFDFNAPQGKQLPDFEDFETIQSAFDFNLDLAASMEGRGFEGVFYSEHHFVNSTSPTPNLLVAALASRTRTLKIGVMGNVLPFHQPWRLAEELSMLDYLTRGRLEIGFASGVPPEFMFINMPQADIRPIYTEILDFLGLAYEKKYVTFKGRYFNFEELPVMPRPRKESRRRHWITIYSESSCRDAARRNYKVCTGYQSVDSARQAFDGYREEAAKLGHLVGPDDIGIRRQVLLGDTDAIAKQLDAELQESAKARVDAIFKEVFERLAKAGLAPPSSVTKSGVIDADAVPREGQAAIEGQKAPKGFVISPDEYICGSPASVAEQIIDQCRRMGAGNIFGYHIPSMDRAQIQRNYALWEQLIPILRKAEVSPRRA